MDAEALAHDPILDGKSSYLNWMFMAARQLVIFGAWYFMWRRFRKRSLEEDLGYDRSRHFKNVRDSAIFLIIFGYPISTFVPWDWIMSIDAHWFSTLFGWYVFSGLWLSALVVTTLMVIWLKKQGYMADVNASHIHDLGKWVFGVSFLWSYLLFSQFMLIWYSNIPEEVTYFQVRFEEFKILYWGMFIVNFTFPMIALMKTHSHLNLFEIGLALGFLGLFLFVVLNTLTKAPLMAKNHPFYEESKHHEIH